MVNEPSQIKRWFSSEQIIRHENHMVNSMSRLKILARRFVARNLSWFVRFVVMMKLRSMNLTKANPVLILTMGKVGSSSVYHSLKGTIGRAGVSFAQIFSRRHKGGKNIASTVAP